MNAAKGALRAEGTLDRVPTSALVALCFSIMQVIDHRESTGSQATPEASTTVPPPPPLYEIPDGPRRGIAALTMTWTCTRCNATGHGPTMFGFRRMPDGSIRSQPQCRECRREASHLSRENARKEHDRIQMNSQKKRKYSRRARTEKSKGAPVPRPSRSDPKPQPRKTQRHRKASASNREAA